MKRTTLRAAGASAIAAVVLGIAAPAASAATSAIPAHAATAGAVSHTAGLQQPGTFSLSATGTVTGDLGSGAPGPSSSPGGVADSESAAANKGKAFLELLKRTGGLFKKAADKAKAGRAAFEEWIGQQNWTVRAAWWALSGGSQAYVFDVLANWIG